MLKNASGGATARGRRRSVPKPILASEPLCAAPPNLAAAPNRLPSHARASSPPTTSTGTLRRPSPWASSVRGAPRTTPTAADQKAMLKRTVWVEPRFAEAKAWHGLQRLLLRGLGTANSQGLLLAAGQNLKRFLTASG